MLLRTQQQINLNLPAENTLPIHVLRNVSVENLASYIELLSSRESALNEIGRMSMKVFSNSSPGNDLVIFGEWVSEKALRDYEEDVIKQGRASKIGLKFNTYSLLYHLTFHRIVDSIPKSEGFYLMSTYKIDERDNYIAKFKEIFTNEVLKQLGLCEIEMYLKETDDNSAVMLSHWKSEEHFNNYSDSDFSKRTFDKFHLEPPKNTILNLVYFC